MNKEQNHLNNIVFFNEMFKNENYKIGVSIGKHLNEKEDRYYCEICSKELKRTGLDYDEIEEGICLECLENKKLRDYEIMSNMQYEQDQLI